jgi:hypothetical protein
VSKSPVILAIAAGVAAAQFGCGSDDEAATPPSKPAANGHISSSIAEGAQLSDPLRWSARLTSVPSSEVASVRFLIDGKVAHVEQETPYQFAGLRNVLIPGTLGDGSHTFAVDVRLTDGRRLTAASTATVTKDAQGIPPAVVGHWTRVIKPADVRRTEGFRKAEYGVPLPVGTWKVQIGADGVVRYVDPTPVHDLTVGQVRFASNGRLIVGNEIPNFPQASEGSFCPDTVGSGEYRWSVEGETLVVKAVDDRECADRNSLWSGRFTR